jgi:hypothetical protein
MTIPGQESNRNTEATRNTGLLEQDKRKAIFDKFIKDKGIKPEESTSTLNASETEVHRDRRGQVGTSMVSNLQSQYSSASKLSINPLDLISNFTRRVEAAKKKNNYDMNSSITMQKTLKSMDVLSQKSNNIKRRIT